MRYWTHAATFMCAAGLLACGGQERTSDGTAEATGQPAAEEQQRNPSSAEAPAAGAAGQSAPAVGKTHEIKMIGDAQGYRFEPASLTINVGDAVRWTLVSGPPHNVTFWKDSIPQGAAAPLQSNMPETVAPLMGPMKMAPGESYTVSFAGVPEGEYGYYCVPHVALGMVASLTVR